MTLLQKCKQITNDFILKYLPMNKLMMRCGNELIFQDDDDNLIYIQVSYIRKDKERQLTEYLNDKMMTLREKQHDYEARYGHRE